MRWIKIDKASCVQPSTGSYPDWKHLLAAEGHHQCVYCAIPDSSLGGIRNFHVEHFKPKSKFKPLTNDIKNLFYACPVCNTFKNDDWPCDSDGTLMSHCYPDPSVVDYNTLFVVQKNAVIEGLHPQGKYLVVKLYLNRKQLIIERRRAKALATLMEISKSVGPKGEQLAKRVDADSRELLQELFATQSRLIKLFAETAQLGSYKQEDMSRPH